MTAPPPQAERDACRQCRRRSWLLGELSPLLDYQRGDPERLAALLELCDEKLIEALGGRRRAELSAAWDSFSTSSNASGCGLLCRHSVHWPLRLRECNPPTMLWFMGVAGELERRLAAPTVALLGTRHPSPYGLAMARRLARGLTAAGVTIAGPLLGGLAAAAHRGAIEGAGGSLALAGDGLARIRPASAERLARELGQAGCLLSELEPKASGRGWGVHMAQRTAVGLADLVVLVEASETPAELLGARMAASLGRPLAAIPGPASSSLSAGPHSLIRTGASLVRGAGDVLELLYEQGHDRLGPGPLAPRPEVLAPRLRSLLLRVGAGEDTPERLCRGAHDLGAVLSGLGELEAMGLLERLPAGRYMTREPMGGGHPAA